MRLLIFLLCLTTFGLSAHAEKDQFTEKEKAVFAFHKLAQTTPDYHGWIASRKAFKAASKEIQLAFLDQESARLKKAFEDYVPRRDFLSIKTDVEIYISSQGGRDFLHFRFPGSYGTEYPYFPYPYQDEWIGLVLNDLSNFTIMSLEDWQWKNVLPLFRKQALVPVTLRMEVKPVAVNADKPITYANEPFWIMNGDIAYLVFETEDFTVFNYTAPWYSDYALEQHPK